MPFVFKTISLEFSDTLLMASPLLIDNSDNFDKSVKSAYNLLWNNVYCSLISLIASYKIVIEDIISLLEEDFSSVISFNLFIFSSKL